MKLPLSKIKIRCEQKLHAYLMHREDGVKFNFFLLYQIINYYFENFQFNIIIIFKGLSGTPMENSVDDLFSLFKFL